MKQSAKAFAKAVLLGTLAGAAVPMALTVPLAIGDYLEPLTAERRLFVDIYLAGLPLWISFALVLASSIVLGLPIHFLLQKLRVRSKWTYVSIGAIAGFTVTLAVLLAIGAVAGFWTVFLGAFSGAITAMSWSNSLKRPAR